MLVHSSRDDCFLINFRGEIAQLFNYVLGFHKAVASRRVSALIVGQRPVCLPFGYLVKPFASLLYAYTCEHRYKHLEVSGNITLNRLSCLNDLVDVLRQYVKINNAASLLSCCSFSIRSKF